MKCMCTRANARSIVLTKSKLILGLFLMSSFGEISVRSADIRARVVQSVQLNLNQLDELCKSPNTVAEVLPFDYAKLDSCSATTKTSFANRKERKYIHNANGSFKWCRRNRVRAKAGHTNSAMIPLTISDNFRMRLE